MTPYAKKRKLQLLMSAGHMFKTVAKRMGLTDEGLRALIRETFRA